jgi:UDP-N-acetylmuramate: L-alanyl-gamma-D-glutamyl-meso-diaminopimelate ligase
MNVHFIAIGGSAMHNLAIALSRKGEKVTGSDDEIFEPSRSRLAKQGILPQTIGWDESRITDTLDAVILGMHAREDNPELLKAKELGLPIFSYPEYLYEQSKDKIRVVIGGSHGKTTITSMLLHVVNKLGIDVDYMVGAQLEGYDCMVKLSDDAPIMILEGDEYLSSPIDRRPKFHLYKPNIAIISGIAWDHINVFPTFANYVEQFDVFCQCIEQGGVFVSNKEDEEVKRLAEKYTDLLNVVPYSTPQFEVTPTGSKVHWEGQDYTWDLFGSHNLQNAMGALQLAKAMGIEPAQFMLAMQDFKGAGKRLQKVVENDHFVMYKDFAHSPSKLKATTKAVKEQYPDRNVVACMELHTFSSLRKDFLPQYDQSMINADVALVYFSPAVVAHKKLDPITKDDVLQAFNSDLVVANQTEEVLQFIRKQDWSNSVLLMMSSGTFDGIDYDKLGEELLKI